MYILCGLVGGVTLAAITIYVVRRRSRLHDKLTNWMTSGQQPPSEEYKVCSTTRYDMIRYDSVYLTCSKKLTGSQLSLPHSINKKLKCETKNKMVSMMVRSSPVIVRQSSR